MFVLIYSNKYTLFIILCQFLARLGATLICVDVSSWLRAARTDLQAHNVPSAELDALVLLEDAVGKDRAWLLARPEYQLSTAQQQKLKNVLKRRAQHEPLAYIRQKIEFYGREFVLTPAVLQPRPESETMIDLLKELPLKSAQPIIADVGTGSGAIGITAQLELPQSQVELLEIDPKACKVAKINVDKFTLNIPVIAGDLLAQTKSPYDILLCNLPYVPDDFRINLAAGHEPKRAIFGGADGLDLYRRLGNQVNKRPDKPLYILCESLPYQHADLARIVAEVGYKQVQEADFIQVFTYQK